MKNFQIETFLLLIKSFYIMRKMKDLSIETRHRQWDMTKKTGECLNTVDKFRQFKFCQLWLISPKFGLVCHPFNSFLYYLHAFELGTFMLVTRFFLRSIASTFNLRKITILPCIDITINNIRVLALVNLYFVIFILSQS